MFSHYSRDAIKEAVEHNGDHIVSCISAKTDHVLAGDKMEHEKLKKVEAMGIPIISEEDLSEMIGAGGSESLHYPHIERHTKCDIEGECDAQGHGNV